MTFGHGAAIIATAVALLSAGTRPAQALDLPIGPGNEGAIKALTAPYPSEGPLGDGLGTLAHIRIGGWEITYVVEKDGKTAAVKVSFDQKTRAATVAVDVPEVPGAKALASAIRKNLAPVKVRQRSDLTGSGSRGDPEAGSDETPFQRAHTIGMLLLYLLGVILARRALGRELATAWKDGGPAALVVIVASATVCVLLPDTVIYHHGHGWAMANAIAVDGEYHQGATAHLLPRLLGALGSHGWEANVASRVGYTLALPLAWLWARALFKSRYAALVVLGVFATQPGLFYVAGSPFVSSTALFVVTLAGWHATVALRTADLRLLLPAVGALALLANFRVIGVFMGPGLAALALAAIPDRPLSRRYLSLLAVGVLVIVALAVPRLLGIVSLQSSHQMTLPSVHQVLVGGILTYQHWIPRALSWLVLAAGVVMVLPRRSIPKPYRGRVLFGATALAIAMPLVFGVMAVDNWVNVMRYQGWVVVPMALAVGALVEWVETLRIPQWQLASVAGVVVGAYAISAWIPAQAYSFDHPEQIQLQIWKDLDERLPRGARLAIPETRGEHSIGMPFVALVSARPDIVLVKVPNAVSGRPDADFWFEPLVCSLPFFETEPSRDACLLSRRGRNEGWMHPVYVARAALEHRQLYEDAGPASMDAHEHYWLAPSVAYSPPHYVGLYSVDPGP